MIDVSRSSLWRWSKIDFLDTVSGDKVSTKPALGVHFLVAGFTGKNMPAVFMNVNEGILLAYRAKVGDYFLGSYL